MPNPPFLNSGVLPMKYTVMTLGFISFVFLMAFGSALMWSSNFVHSILGIAIIISTFVAPAIILDLRNKQEEKK